MNFHSRTLKDGLKRMVNEFPDTGLGTTLAPARINR
jgi:hypothetical protein